MARLTPQFSALWIVAVDPFFVPRHYLMQKTLPILPLEQLFAREKTAFDVSWLEFMRNPIYLFLHHKFVITLKSLVKSLPMFQRPLLQFGMILSPIMPPTQRLQTLLNSLRVLCHWCQNRHAWNFKLKQKGSAPCKCSFVGTKVDIVRAQRMRIVYTLAKWHILIIRGKWWCFIMYIVTWWTDAF